jgi:hypothetical protein
MKIMIMNYKNIILTWIFFFIWIAGLRAQSFTESKKIEKIFPASSSTSVEIINKYGKIHVLSWDKDSIGIDIELTVKSDDLSKVKKVMNTIDFGFTNTDYYVIAETEFGKRYNSLFENIKNLAESLIPSDNVVEINYTVQIPETIEMKINNKYGDVYIDNHKGKMKIHISNGDLKANDIKGTADIHIEIGNGVINHIEEGRLDIAYSEFEIKNGGDLVIYCRSSKVDIGSIRSINLDSRRDKLFVNEINRISGETYFSDLHIYDITGELNLTMKYGSLDLEYIQSVFSFLNVNSNYTDINLNFDQGSSYLMDVNHTNAEFTYPERLGIIEEKVIDRDRKELNTYGKIGDSEHSSKVKITAIKGTITIIHK